MIGLCHPSMKVKSKWARAPIAALVIGLLISASSCERTVETNSPAGGPDFIRAFSDYDFVGMGRGGDDPAAISPHGATAQPLPSEFLAGHQYIFHRPSKANDTEVFSELQERLKSHGVQVLHAGCCLDRIIGGPGFNIRFKDGKYRGVIFNPFDGQIAYDPDLSRRYDVDDYVVVIEEAAGDGAG
jgi:hypothetical protein